MIQITPARMVDSIIFYNARFNPIAIQHSKIKDNPTYSEHVEWFKRNYLTGFYTILEENNPVGYIRIDDKNTISIAILPEHQKKGIATKSLKQILKIHKNLNAEIYTENTASLKLFKKFPEIELNIIDDRHHDHGLHFVKSEGMTKNMHK